MAKTTRNGTHHQVSLSKTKLNPQTAPAGDYAVGYGRPPTGRRWRPGQSGNPNGRPRKASSSKEAMALEALERKIEVDEAGRSRKQSVRQMAFQRIGEKAAAGDLKSANFLLAKETEERQLGAGRSGVPLETALKIIRKYLERQQASKEKDNDDQA